MPIDAPPDLGTVFECASCGERTIHRDRCPTCGSTELEAVN